MPAKKTPPKFPQVGKGALVHFPNFPERLHRNQLQKSYRENRNLNPSLSAEVFNNQWIELILSQINLQLYVDQDEWKFDQDLAPDDVNYSDLVAVRFESSLSPKRPRANSGDSLETDFPPTAVRKPSVQSPSKEPEDDGLASSDNGEESDSSMTQDQSEQSSHVLGYNLLEGKTRVTGIFPLPCLLLSDSKSEVISGTLQDLTDRWESPHVLSYPVKIQTTTITTYLVLPSGDLGVRFSQKIPQSSLKSFPTIEQMNLSLSSAISTSSLVLVSNFPSGHKFSTGIFPASSIIEELAHLSLASGFLTLLPIQDSFQAKDSIKLLKFVSINGRKDPANIKRISKVCNNFINAKTLTLSLPESYILWHSASAVASEMITLADSIKEIKTSIDPPQSISAASASSLSKFQSYNSSESRVSAHHLPPLEISDSLKDAMFLKYQINLNMLEESHLVVISVNRHLTIGHQLELIRRALSSLAKPIPEEHTEFHAPIQWARCLTAMNANSNVPLFKHGNRVCFVKVLSHSTMFGLHPEGRALPLVSVDSRTKMGISPQEQITFKAYHPDGYFFPEYHTLTSMVLPPRFEDALLLVQTPLLLYVRGFGSNFDAHNIMLPLILDNVCQASGLLQNDIFGIPITLQAKSPVKQGELTVMVEEQVIAVLFNHKTVSPSDKMKALAAIGLADSTMSVQVVLRGIMVEYISDSDVIISNPVPSTNKVNMIMIPMETGTCGLRLASLIVASGSITVDTLLHFAVLPYNTHGRFEFRFQRMYLFLTANTLFKDTMAITHQSITAMLCQDSTLSRSFYKSEYLPGIQQALSVEGQWSVNRSLLVGGPRTSLLVATPRLFPPSVSSTRNHTSNEAESLSNPSDLSTPSSVQPNDLTNEFQVTSLSSGERQLLQSNDRIALAIEALHSLMLKVHSPAPESYGDKT